MATSPYVYVIVCNIYLLLVAIVYVCVCVWWGFYIRRCDQGVNISCVQHSAVHGHMVLNQRCVCIHVTNTHTHTHLRDEVSYASANNEHHNTLKPNGCKLTTYPPDCEGARMGNQVLVLLQRTAAAGEKRQLSVPADERN